MKRARSDFWLAALVALAFLVVASSARADEGEPDAALAHGVALRRERKDAEALAEFRRAYALAPTARALAQIALAEAALEKWVTAESDLLHALVADEPWIARQRSALQLALTEIQRHLVTLEVAGTEGAEVWIDGELAGHVPAAALRVLAKHLVLEIRAPGFDTARREVDAEPGATVREVVRLEPARATAAPPSTSLPPDTANARGLPAKPEAERGSVQKSAAWVAAGGAVVFLAGGVASTIVGSSTASHYNDPSCDLAGSPRSVQCASDASRLRAAEALEVVGYGVAGAAAVTSAVLFLTLPGRAAAKTGAWCAPVVGGAVCGYVF